MVLLNDFFNWFWGWAEIEKKKALEELKPRPVFESIPKPHDSSYWSEGYNEDILTVPKEEHPVEDKKKAKKPIRGRNGRTTKIRN